MSGKDVIGLTADELKAYIESHPEEDYLLIDVRQPGEYSDAHIPGATLIPLPTVESRLNNLPAGRDMIFYCRSGGRSHAAATFAIENRVTQNPVYHLEGGILSWSGQSRPGFPRVKFFYGPKSPSDAMYTAMEMEKGAWRLYQQILTQYPGAVFADAIAGMAEVEIGHARLCYEFWAPLQSEPPKSFSAVFDGLKGDILEGGEDISEIVDAFPASDAAGCIEIMELALEMETAAYDLYRTAAVDLADAGAGEFLTRIAQAEKDHMRQLAEALQKCDPVAE